MKQRRTGFPFSQEPLEPGSSEFRLPRCSLTQQSCHIAGVPSLARYSMNRQALSSLIWSVADLLRGNFKQSEYGP